MKNAPYHIKYCRTAVDLRSRVVLIAIFYHCLLLGMNCNERVVTEHIKYEPTTYNAAYFIEIEAASSPMWSLIAASSVLVSLYVQPAFN